MIYFLTKYFWEDKMMMSECLLYDLESFKKLKYLQWIVGCYKKFWRIFEQYRTVSFCIISLICATIFKVENIYTATEPLFILISFTSIIPLPPLYIGSLLVTW